MVAVSCWWFWYVRVGLGGIVVVDLPFVDGCCVMCGRILPGTCLTLGCCFLICIYVFSCLIVCRFGV